jgi:hypothetical protein
MPTSTEATIIRQVWHENPPGVVIAFGVGLIILWYINSAKTLSYVILYAGIFLLLGGIISEVLWVFWFKRKSKS